MTRMWAIGLLILAAAAAPAAAQNAGQNTASDAASTEELRRELNTLSRQVEAMREELARIRGENTPDDGSVTPNVAARFEVRLSQLERTIQDLTGRVEQAEHQLRQVNERIDLFQRDMEFRVQQLENGSGSSAGTQQQGRQQGDAAGQQRQREQQPERRRSGDDGGATSSQRAEADAQSSGDPEQDYRTAVAFLRQQDYPRAEASLQSFIENHPQHQRTASAHYFLGEIYYMQRRYEDAAVQFADGFQNFQDHPRAPQNLLKLGMSLARMERQGDACQTFAELRRRYPDAGNHIERTEAEERRRLGCR